MKLVLVSLFIFTGTLFSQSTKINAEKNAGVEQEIQKIEMDLENSIMTGDVEKYSSLLAADYLLINPAGVVVTRDQIVAALKASGASKGDSLLTDNLKVRVYGETAVL